LQLRHCEDAGGALTILFAEEARSVVNSADEVLHDLPPDLVINNAQPCSPTEELFEAERLVVVDDFVVRESHEEVCEADAAVGAFG